VCIVNVSTIIIFVDYTFTNKDKRVVGNEEENYIIVERKPFSSLTVRKINTGV
jgi:hypothetical protein